MQVATGELQGCTRGQQQAESLVGAAENLKIFTYLFPYFIRKCLFTMYHVMFNRGDMCRTTCFTSC